MEDQSALTDFTDRTDSRGWLFPLGTPAGLFRFAFEKYLVFGHVLREAMRGTLPAAILERRKMGFPVPVGRWLRGPYRWLIDEYVLGERTAARDLFEPAVVRRLVEAHQRGENHTERLWSLINLEIWQRIFLDGEDAQHVVVEGQREVLPRTMMPRRLRAGMA